MPLDVEASVGRHSSNPAQSACVRTFYVAGHTMATINVNTMDDLGNRTFIILRPDSIGYQIDAFQALLTDVLEHDLNQYLNSISMGEARV